MEKIMLKKLGTLSFLRTIFVCIVMLLALYNTANARENFENPLNKKYCNEVNGVFDGKFADCIYDNYVVEGEVLSKKSKIYEAIGQILYYASELDNKQMVIWVYKHPKTKDKTFKRYLKLLKNTIKYHNLNILVVVKNI